jgi:serine protease Do
MTTTLPADGTYTVLANAYQPGETGRYTLRLDTSSSTAQTAPPNTRPNRVAAGGTTPQDRARVILQEQGVLDASSPVLRSDGSRYREYTFSGNAGQTITITLESGDFDTYLMLIDPSNRMLRDNDDSAPDNTNSTLTVTLPATGTYKVIANAYDRSGQGRFTLTVRGQ